MHILQLISSSGLFGAERLVIELSKGLRTIHGCRATVGVIKNSQNPHIEVAEEARVEGLDTVVFRCRNRIDFHTIREIQRFMQESKVNLIHCHGYKSNFYGLLASRNMVPAVSTNHNWLRWHWKLGVYCLLDSVWIRCFDRIVAVSHEIKEEMLKYKIPEARIKVIDNGIDINRFRGATPDKDIKADLGIEDGLKVVGTIGSLGREKGQIYLLRAAQGILARDESVRFLIIGDGPLRKHLEDETEKLGIRSEVIFTGYRQDIPELLSIMDLFVLPSIKEGLPMVLLEAMAARKAVIATEVGAIPKVVRHNENGILVGSRDTDALQKAIIDLMQDKEKRGRLAVEGNKRVEREFSSREMCGKYFALYSELTSCRGDASRA